jgi:branched-chain amino acid transport system substrate-binding protein
VPADNDSSVDLLKRRFVKVAAASIAFPTILNSSAHAYLNQPKGDSVVLGLNVPLSGPYADEGADELRGYKLAIKHLNGEGDGGMLNSMTNCVLRGDGVNGKRVAFSSSDTESNPNLARDSAKRMIEKDGAVMITGGSSSDVAVAVQDLCQEAGVIFMAGLTHSNDTTGKDRKKNGFRHFFNTEMTGAALAPILKKEFGADRKVYHITADYSWGWSQEKSIKKYTERLGWRSEDAVRTPLGTVDFNQYLTPIIDSGADVLVLNHYGRDMVNSLTQAVQSGLRDRVVNGNNFQIVVPLFSRLMAHGVGENIKGIYGSANWNWSLTDKGSETFVRSFGAEYGFPPSQAAHTCYVQTLLYANACQMAGTFNPCGVIEALEGFKFDGMGNGPTEYRATDHQCFKDVLVVKGAEKTSSQFDLLEVVEVTPRERVEYADDQDFVAGSLGDCNPGS